MGNKIDFLCDSIGKTQEAWTIKPKNDREKVIQSERSEAREESIELKSFRIEAIRRTLYSPKSGVYIVQINKST